MLNKQTLIVRQIVAKYPWLAALAILVAIAGGALTWYLASPLK